ncbi:MAG: prepilin-type N-terminal cleavage/methylation domain-containing protein, partial [Pseudomonadales bacterium]
MRALRAQHIGRQAGFTLVELVMVIVLLGVVGVGMSSLISTSVQAYVDVSRR